MSMAGLEGALIGGDPDLRQVAAQNPDLDLDAIDLYDPEAIAGLSLPPESREAALEKVRRCQRVARLAPDAETAAALLEAGLDSAHRIAAMPEHRFLREHGELFDHRYAAREVHQRAVAVRTRIFHAYANLRDVLSPHLRALHADPVDDSLRDYVAAIPDYQELFGSLDALACEECASIFGPAAYFLDLMRVTDDYVTDVNQPTGGRALKERRPDLFELELTCENAERELPTLEIVSEVLARRIALEQPLATGTAGGGTASTIVLGAQASSEDGAYDGIEVSLTAGTGAGQRRTITAYAGKSKVATVSEPWRTTPDATSTYRLNRDAFVSLAAAPYPFNLPWNLPLQKTRRQLGALGVSLADLYEAFTAPIEVGVAQGGSAASIVLATSASSKDGAYEAVRVALVGGTGAGQERRISAYEGSKREATVAPGWTVAPDGTSRYELLDDRPAARERLGLSIEQEEMVTTPRTTGAELAPCFGVGSIVLDEIGLVQTFLQRTGLQRGQLLELLTQGLSKEELEAGGAAVFFVNATGESPAAMRIVTEATDPNDPVERIEGLTLARLDRLNRFIRLSAELGWSYEELDWALRSLGRTEIDVPALVGLALIRRLEAAGELGVLQLCAFWADLKTSGRGDGPAPADLFDRTFNAPAALAGRDPYTSTKPIPFDPSRPLTWDPAASGGPDGEIRGRLRSALAVGDDDLTRIAANVGSLLGLSGPIKLELSTLSWFYRLATAARLLGLTVEESLVLLRLAHFPEDPLPPAGSLTPNLDSVFEDWQLAQWLRSSPFTVWSLAYATAGIAGGGFRPPFEPDDVVRLVEGAATQAAPLRLGPASFAGGQVTEAASAAIFAGLVADGFLTADGIALDTDERFLAAAGAFPLTPKSLEAGAIGEAEAQAAFTALEAVEPPLLEPIVKGKPGTAALTPWFDSGTDLGFLFPGDAEAANKRTQVVGVLLATRREVVFSQFAGLLPLGAADLVASAVDEGGAERALAELMQAKPALVAPSPAAGEARMASGYDGPTRTLTVAPAWDAVPPVGAPYAVVEKVGEGTAQAGDLQTITLAADAAAADGAYDGVLVALTAGSGKGETGAIIAYDGTTKLARCAAAWVTPPDATTSYELRQVVAEGAARGADSTHLQLAADAAPTNGAYTGATVTLAETGSLSPLFDASTDLAFLFASTGAGQVRQISAYVGATRAATVTPAWSTAPDATSAYLVSKPATAGTARGGDGTTIVLAESADPGDGAYVGMTVAIESGTGSGEQAVITAYTGATRSAEVSPAWTTAPDSSSAYAVSQTLATGTARGGGPETILLEPGADAADGGYDGMTVAIIPDPNGALRAGQVRQALEGRRQQIEQIAGIFDTAAGAQREVAIHGLAGFLGAGVEELRALVPIATAEVDLCALVAELLTPPAGGQVAASLRGVLDRLGRTRSLFEQLGASVEQMRGVATLPQAFNVSADLDFSLASVRALAAMAAVEAASGDRGRALVEYLGRPPDPSPPGPKVEALGALTGWPPAQVEKLVALLWPGGEGFSEFDPRTVAGIARLQGCSDLSLRTGLGASSLLALSALATLPLLGPGGTVAQAAWQTYEQAAALTLAALSARFAGGDGAGLEQALEAKLNEARRDALLGYAIHLLSAEAPEVDSPDALYQYLLIDPEMGGCATTSRIAQGIGSLQLYLQRCRMMLEPGISDLSQIPEEWWDWLSTYRVWEANRRVFLYPENYLRPGSRRGASPPFERLTRSLTEANVTDANVSEALRTYLAEFSTVANLSICGAYEARQEKAGTSVVQTTGVATAAKSDEIQLAESASHLFNRYAGMTIEITAGPGAGQRARIVEYSGEERWATVTPAWGTVPGPSSSYVVTGPRSVDTLALVGRTSTDPDTFYHRRCETGSGWTPWLEVKLPIPSPLVSPVLAFDRLHLLWSEVKTVEASKISPGSGSAGPSSIPLASSSATIRLTSLEPDGSWSPPQTVAEEVVLDYQVAYELEAYLRGALPLLAGYFDSDLVIWRKVYPLRVPARKVTAPETMIRGEQILVSHGFATGWQQGLKVPVPKPPAPNVPSQLLALQESAHSLLSRANTLSQNAIPSGSLQLASSHAIDAALNRAELDMATLLEPELTSYFPVIDREDGQLGIAAGTGSVFLSDFYPDDYPSASLPGRPPATVPLLAEVAGMLASVTTVTNRPGSFLFDNGDEAFLVRSSDPGLLTLSEALIAISPNVPFPPGNLYLRCQQLTTTNPPKKPEELEFAFSRLTTDAGRRLAERLANTSLDGLLSLEAQRTPELPFSRLAPAKAVIPPATETLDFDGAYGLYFWELFFHAPFLIADTLGAEQRFAEATAWLQRIFNPTQAPETGAAGNECFWRFLPFRGMTLESLAETLANPEQISAYNDDPLNPDAIARLRISAYAKAVVLRYVDNLLDWADFLFAQDTRESIDQATNLYVMAADLLGPRPQAQGAAPRPRPASFEDVRAAYTDRTVTTGTVAAATAATVTLAAAASPLDDAYTGLYVEITAGPGSGSSAYVLGYDGATRTARLAGPWPTPPTAASIYRVFAHGIPQFLVRLENTGVAGRAVGTDQRLAEVPFNQIGTYFCVPENDRLTDCWDRVEDRLFKIRNCMNIAGQARPLALFSPPLDVRTLIEARAAGNAGPPIAAQAQMPVPKYRFPALLERARAMAAAVSQLGSALLTALERRDGEALALLQSSQQGQLLDLATLVREQQVEEAKQSGVALAASLAAAQARREHYASLAEKQLSPAEIAHITTMTAAAVFNVVGTALRTSSGFAYAAPQVGSPFAMTYGGKQVGSSLASWAAVFEGLGVVSNFGSQLSMTLAQYQRREEEWALQEQLASHDADQIVAQQAVNAATLAVAERELLANRRTLAQNRAMEAFLKSKFSNEELYGWMASRLSTLHLQTYTLALDLARSAQRAYQYELGTDRSFVRFDYWDEGRRGLLAGEGVALALNQMEHSYLEANIRALEVEKTVSLLQVNPRALLDLVESGECIFELPEKLFDEDFPGHYARRIKTLTVSIPALTGPYQNIHATLTQLSNQLVLKPDPGAVSFLLGTADAPTPAADALRSNWWTDQQIVLSTGVEDGGGAASAPGDERYLPFEGTGAVSSWRLSMPKQTNRIDFGSISDVVLNLRYTALDGGARFRDQVLGLPAMRTVAGSVFLPLAQRFSSEWYAFLHRQPEGPDQVLEFELADLVPPHVSRARVTGFFFHLDTPAGVRASAGKPYLHLQLGTQAEVAFDLDANAGHTHTFTAPPAAADTEGPATLGFRLADTPAGLKTSGPNPVLDPKRVQNAALVLFYEGRTAR